MQDQKVYDHHENSSLEEPSKTFQELNEILNVDVMAVKDERCRHNRDPRFDGGRSWVTLFVSAESMFLSAADSRDHCSVKAKVEAANVDRVHYHYTKGVLWEAVAVIPPWVIRHVSWKVMYPEADDRGTVEGMASFDHLCRYTAVE